MTINSKFIDDFMDTVSFYVSTVTSSDPIGLSYPSRTGNINYFESPYDYNLPTIRYYYGYHQTNPSFPAIDVIQSKKDDFMIIKMAVAGFKKSDLTLETKDNSLIVSGAIGTEKPYKEDEVFYVKQCLKAESFSKKFIFPDDRFDFRNPKVTLTDGMLTIQIERNPELKSKDKKIAIE